MLLVGELDRVPVRQTGIGTRYVLMEDVPEQAREVFWRHLGTQRAKLIIEGIGRAALLQDWLSWVELQRKGS